MSNVVYTMNSIDTKNVGQPPSVDFISTDPSTYLAMPPGAKIEIKRISLNASVIMLADDFNQGEPLYVTLHDQVNPVHEQWKDCGVFAREVASSLYWSQWRMQRARGQL